MKNMLLSTLLLSLLVTAGCQKAPVQNRTLGEPPLLEAEPDTNF